MILRLLKKKTILFFSFLLFFNIFYSLSATTVVDSLETNLDLTKKDTIQLKLLIDLSVKYLNVDPGKAFNYGNKALKLSIELGSDDEIAESYYNLGIIQYYFGNYDLALENFNNSLELMIVVKNEVGLFECYKSIGVVHQAKGDYVKAIEYSFKALEIAEEVGSEVDEASIKGNLGIISDLQGKPDNALTYFMEALAIFKEFGSRNQVSTTLSNIGNVYLSQNQFDFAIDYYLRSLSIKEKLQNKRQIAVGRGNIAVAYHNQKKYNQALEYFHLSLKIYEEMEDKKSIALSYNNIGSTHLEQKRYSLAEVFFHKSLGLSKKIGAKELIKVGYQNLSELYSKSKKFEKALSYYELYVEIKDSIQNKEVMSKIATVQSNYEIEKKEKKIVLLEKDRIEQEFQLKRRNVVIYLILLSVLIISLLFVVFVRNAKIKRVSLKEKQSLLKDRLTSKERELSSTVTYIANKNNILSETKDDLKALLDIITESTTRFKLRGVITKIEGNLNIFEDWQNFKGQFDEIYPGYINRLIKEYSNISHNDMKLCVYIKMGVSNKEIAQLQNMTLDGVKSANKRLKKKMNLSSEISLSDFVRQF